MKLFAVTMAIAMLLAPAALAGPSIVGNFQGWDPADPAYDLTVNGNGVYVLTIAAGDSLHEYKAVDGDAWGDDFPGANQTFTPASPENVTFFVNLGAVPGTKQGDEYVFHSLNPPIVCGSFMSELGGSDWDQTDTSTTVMSDPDLDDVWEFSSVIPAGTYAFKIVLNNNWDQNTSPGGDIPFGSNGIDPVLFRYHMATNTTEVFTSAPPTVLYSRLGNGCPTNLSAVEVRFSKDVEETSAETTTNYTVSSPIGTTVVSATRDDTDNSLVVLELSPALAGGDDFGVVVSGVTDTDLTPVDPTANDACFYVHEVIFELNMDLYADANGIPTSVHIQGDTYPLTWEQCLGCEAFDDGAQGGDAAAGDTTYTVTEYFSMQYDCGASADTAEVKYKYIVDCTTWEGDYEFGHYVTLDPNLASQTANVWWDDVAPVDNIQCDVGVLFQVHNAPACASGLFVRGTELPLDWSTGVEMFDDGTGGDVTPGDGIYSAEVVFPTGTYKFLEYKYFCASSDTTGTYECDTLPNRALTLDDVNGCVTVREGPMVLEELWNWCEPVTGTGQNIEETSWGHIKSLYRRD
jgi:hypothetical protein